MPSQSGDAPDEQHSDQPDQPGQPEPIAYLPDTTATSERPDFPIVGIGASAGGLEAFEKFFAHMPRDSGIAFILAQHLTPGRQNLLGDIMERFTAMQVRVVQANDGTVVQPNRVYILPPNYDATLRNNTLFMSEPEPVAGVRLPIDNEQPACCHGCQGVPGEIPRQHIGTEAAEHKGEQHGDVVAITRANGQV